MDPRLQHEFLAVVNETAAKRRAEASRFHPGKTDDEIRTLTAMAAGLKTALEDMGREVFDKAGLFNPMRNLQITLYRHKTQETVVGFMIGNRPYQIAAVMDADNRPVFRGITPDAVNLLREAEVFGDIENIQKTVFKGLVSMLSRESLNQLQTALEPKPPRHS